MNKPLISVVMAICNVERYLAESIESILGQTFLDFEFIIVDFGSTDKSKTIAASYAAKDERVKFHEIPPCVLAVARNAGCFLAQGRYIAVMDADDISLQNRFALQVDYLAKHPEVALLGGATEWVDANGSSLDIHHVPNTYAEIRAALVTHCPFWHPTVIMRTEAFVSVGGYRGAFVCAHDYDLELRIAEQFECANLKQVLLKYRVHPHQLSMRRRREQSLCLLAAQSSAIARMNRNPDPLNSLQAITLESLASLGVTEAALERLNVTECCQWIRNMRLAGEYSVALQAAMEILQSDWQYIEQWQVADLYVTVALIYWKQKKFLKSIGAVGRAIVIRPKVVGRPLRPLLQWLGLV
jgi:GT2 family glycosyltransferase